MVHHDIIVIGASAGGVSALRTLVGGLPKNLQASVFIVLHTPPTGNSILAEILARSASLAVSEAVDGESVRNGHVYVARPDHHLLVKPGRVVLGRGPRENRSRPAVDALFRSAAIAYGPRVIGIVLTGRLDDGTAGLWAVKHAGGIAIVQEPTDAEAPEMPSNAKNAVQVDHCLPVSAMAELLINLTSIPASEVEKPRVGIDGVPILGMTFTCPDCNGPLSQVQAAGETIIRFRCHVGHAYTIMSLLAAQVDEREELLWQTVRSLEDEAALSERAVGLAPSSNGRDALSRQVVAIRTLSMQIREALANMPVPTGVAQALVAVVPPSPELDPSSSP